MFWAQGCVTGARETLSKSRKKGLPWWSSGQDSVLPLPRAWVQSLVGELRTEILQTAWCSQRNKKQNRKYSQWTGTEVKEVSVTHIRQRLGS